MFRKIEDEEHRTSPSPTQTKSLSPKGDDLQKNRLTT